MDLKQEMLSILRRAMETKEYYNPWFLRGLIELMEDTLEFKDEEMPEDINHWINNMWWR